MSCLISRYDIDILPIPTCKLSSSHAGISVYVAFVWVSVGGVNANIKKTKNKNKIKNKKLLKVFSSPGTPQWTVPLRQILDLFGP